jgi:hypothetical protein
VERAPVELVGRNDLCELAQMHHSDAIAHLLDQARSCAMNKYDNPSSERNCSNRFCAWAVMST